jgi:hypothetical protein
MAVYEALLLNTVVPQIQAAQAGDSYVMVVNATTPALRITQTGTGDSILVEDSSNPDSSPFVVTAAGNVGIGSTTPSSYGKLQIKQSGTAFNNGLAVTTSADDSSLFVFDSGLAWKFVAGYLSTGSYKPIVFTTSDIDRMTLDTSGNLGLGVAPSAWAAGFKVFAIGGNNVWSTNDSNTLYLTQNSYFDGAFKYQGSSLAATRHEMANGAFKWYTAPSGTAGNAITFTQAMTLDASGNLGLGTTNPAYKLDINTTANSFFTGIQVRNISNGSSAVASIALGQDTNLTSSAIFVTSSTNTGYGGANSFNIFQGLNAPMAFFTNNTERARITSGGDFIVGGTSANVGVWNKAITLNTASGNAAYELTVAGSAKGFFAADASNVYLQSSGAIPLIFSTNNTERARITSGGEFLVGTTVTGLTGGGVRLKNGGGNLGEIALSNNSGSADYVARFLWGSSATLVGNITVDATSTAYNTSSDYRLKDNPQPLTNSGAFIDALKPKTWDWKSDGSKGVGFIAHEVQEVSPKTVHGVKDAVDEDGNPVYQAMEYGSAEFIANIVAELQSLRARVAQLEAK